MGKYKFVSNRTLKNKVGQETGKLLVLVPAETDIADVKYKCSECCFEESRQQPWLRPFSAKCSKCGNEMKLPKLKDEVKKEQQAEKKRLRGK